MFAISTGYTFAILLLYLCYLALYLKLLCPMTNFPLQHQIWSELIQAWSTWGHPSHQPNHIESAQIPQSRACIPESKPLLEPMISVALVKSSSLLMLIDNQNRVKNGWNMSPIYVHHPKISFFNLIHSYSLCLKMFRVFSCYSGLLQQE